MDALTDQQRRDQGEEDYLDVLARLVEDYETARHPLPGVPDAEMVRHLIEARGITQAKVAADTGIAESTISEVLSGRRRLSRRNVDTLARYFHVSPAVFVVN